MNAAETRASSAIALCTELTVVSRSSTTDAIETFISDVSTTRTNIAAASTSGSRPGVFCVRFADRACGPRSLIRATVWHASMGSHHPYRMSRHRSARGQNRAVGAHPAPAESAASRRRFLAPLALAQFICSFAGSNMNVMINDITEDLHTTVTGVQATITLFLLIMAVLMIPASKLTDRWGRKRCFTAGLVLYGIGALISAAS